MKVLYISPNNQINKRIFPLVNIEQTTDVNEATHCFVEVVSGPCYYPYDAIHFLAIANKMPMIVFDNREYGPMQKEEWTPFPLANPFAYFVRNMDKTKEYPPNVYPYDWPYFEECDFGAISKDELFNRKADCCFYGVESPTRKNFVHGINGVNVEYAFIDHTFRLTLKEWVRLHKDAKCFISCDGGGFTDERIQQLFSVAAILKNKNNHRPNNPFTDKVNCIEVSEHPTKEELDWLVKIVNDKEWLYEIYLNGIAHVKKYYSKEYLSEYVQRIIHEKENSQATKEDVGGVSVQ